MLMTTSLFGATVKPPTLTITAPKPGAKWSNEVYTVTGTATKGSAAVGKVFLSVGAGGWNTATLSNTTWKASILLTVGANTISAYAVDTNGVPSKTNTVTLTYIYAPPVVTITAPKTGTKWSNDVYTVTGTVIPISGGIYKVSVSDNAGGWNTADRSNTNWNEVVNLVAGTNHIAAYATDTNGVPSKTNTVTLIYIPSAVLTVNIVGDGTVAPDYNNDLLAIGGHYTMKATAATGFGFYFWDVGEVMTNSATVHFTMASNLVISAHFKDTTPPTLAITAPKAGGKFTNSVIEVTGTASDNVGVTNVEVQINGGGWVPASGTTNWAAALPMNTGNNTVEAVALDAAGNVSKTNTVSFLGHAPAQQFWAPFSLSNSVITLTSFTTPQMYLSCGSNTFSFADTNRNGDAGVGTYGYAATATNYGLAQLNFLNPPPVGGSETFLDLVFTDFNTGYYTNGFNLDTGTFSIALNPTRFAPTNWLGQKFTFHSGKAVSTLALSKTGSTFNLSLGSTPYFGTYHVVSADGPVAAYLDFVSSDPVTLVTTEFLLQISYTAKGEGIYNVYEYVGNVFTRFYQGPFTSP